MQVSSIMFTDPEKNPKQYSSPEGSKRLSQRHVEPYFFRGYLLGSYLLKKNKIKLLFNVGTVNRQMNQPQEEEIRLPNCVLG